MSKILIVDDEALLVKGLKYSLEQDEHVIDAAYDGKEGLEKFAKNDYDLIILDLMLPEMDGLEVCQKIRESSQVPIIMLTAKGEDMNKILGLEYGADDYLTKPFHPEEFLASVRALLRRTGRWTQSRLICGPVQMDSAEQRVYLHGDEVSLTAYEYRVLQYLMLHAGEVISKTTLTDHLYDEENDRDTNVIEDLILTAASGRLKHCVDGVTVLLLTGVLIEFDSTTPAGCILPGSARLCSDHRHCIAESQSHQFTAVPARAHAGARLLSAWCD